jgi:hypothetical protein
MLMSIGHRDHRGYGTADQDQSDPIPPCLMAVGDTEHVEALSAGKRLRERKLVLVRLWSLCRHRPAWYIGADNGEHRHQEVGRFQSKFPTGVSSF